MSRFITIFWRKSGGFASVSSGGGLGDGLLVCPCALVRSKLELIMSTGRVFASPENTPHHPPTSIYEGNLNLYL